MPEMHLKQPEFTHCACGPFKDLKKQEIHDIFIKMNKIKLFFNITWLKEILRI